MAHTINTTKCIHRINVAEVRQGTPDRVLNSIKGGHLPIGRIGFTHNP